MAAQANTPTTFKVPHNLLTPTETVSVDGQCALESLVLGPDTYTFANPINWQATITNTGSALLVTGSANAVACGTCSRCLDAFEFELEGTLEGYFLFSEDGKPEEGMEKDEFEVLPENKIIDFEPLIKAALLIELPLQPLCKSECKGLCAHCGANLNEGACNCNKNATANDGITGSENANSGSNPFAVLKNIKFD